MPSLPRIGWLVACVLLITLAGCIEPIPVSQLAPPTGPDARVLAGDMNVQNIIGLDEAELWPDEGEPAVLASCAIAFRPPEDAEPSLERIMSAVDVSERNVEAILETFCATLTDEVYERVPLDWMPESEIEREVGPRSENARSQLGMVYDGYGYFGGLGGHYPGLSGGMRDMARELDRGVFIGGITLVVNEDGQIMSSVAGIHGFFQGGNMINAPDLTLVAPTSYIMDDLDSEGLSVLAEAMAIRLAHVIETQSGDWPDEGE